MVNALQFLLAINTINNMYFLLMTQWYCDVFAEVLRPKRDKLLRCVITGKGNRVNTGRKELSSVHWHIETPTLVRQQYHTTLKSIF